MLTKFFTSLGNIGMAFKVKDRYSFQVNVTCQFKKDLQHDFLVNPKTLFETLDLKCPHCGLEFRVDMVDYILRERYVVLKHKVIFYQGCAD